MNYHYTTLTQEGIEKAFKTSVSQGLTDQEANTRQKLYGLNQLKENNHYWFYAFARQLNSPFVYLLIIAAFISLFLEHNKTNAILIFFIIFVNSILGFIQEYRAEQALYLLRKHLAIRARVKRNGSINIFNNKELVPGDIILLQPGDYVPADIRIVQAENLTIDESSLTGESSPVKKGDNTLNKAPQDIYGATNYSFLGTTVISGYAVGIVIATGNTSLFGSISNLTLQTMRESSFQIRVKRLSILIMYIILITLTVLFIFHLILHKGHLNIIQLLLFSITLAISITPEALPVVTTFALSRGALSLVQQGVIVKRLSAIEDLGSVSILCTDKTGTLTENKLTFTNYYMYKDHNVLLYVLLGAQEQSNHPSAIDQALWNGVPKKINKEALAYKRIKEIPFDSALLRNIMLVQKDEKLMLISRGAYEAVVKQCKKLPKQDQKEIEQWIIEQGIQGNRILAVAYKNIRSLTHHLLEQENTMTFAGLVALQDPIKASTYQAVEKAHKLGITIKMLTGDSKEVAHAVAYAVNLIQPDDKVITGDQFKQLSLKEKQHAVHRYAVFARVLPEQKYEIINLLKTGESVGYLGDGINDAPALKVAHVGISVQDGVDIAKDAADIVLLHKSLLVIVNGIAQGRIVFCNILKYIRTTLSSNFGNFYSVAIVALLIDFLPLLPLQLLLINILTDFPMTSIATDRVDHKELKQPSDYDLKGIAFLALILGLVSSLYDFMFFTLFRHNPPAELQTAWFIESVLTELAFIFSIRTRYVFYKAARPSALLMILAFISASISILLPYTQLGYNFFKLIPLPLTDLITIGTIVIAYFITTEIVKLCYYHWSSFMQHNNHFLKGHKSFHKFSSTE